MEWIKTIIEKHTDKDGKVDMSKVNEDIKTESPKNVVPKEVFNTTNEDLKTANKLVEDLKKDNKDVEDLQKKITDYETEVNNLKEERVKEKTNYTLKEKLKEVGAKDVDYMLYKLGEVELDKEGNVIELDNKIKSLTEANPGQFEVKDDPENKTKDTKKDYTVIDNKLEDGKQSDPVATATTDFESALGLTQN